MISNVFLFIELERGLSLFIFFDWVPSSGKAQAVVTQGRPPLGLGLAWSQQVRHRVPWALSGLADFG